MVTPLGLLSVLIRPLRAQVQRASVIVLGVVGRTRSPIRLRWLVGSNAEQFEGSTNELIRALAWDGVKAQSRLLEFSPTGETILDEAYHLDTDLLIMGGYGHSRLREIFFGGMTREILPECEIPVLMAH